MDAKMILGIGLLLFIVGGRPISGDVNCLYMFVQNFRELILEELSIQHCWIC